MSDIPFYRTRMGHVFYEGTMPSLVRELARLNDNVEKVVAFLAVAAGAAPNPPSATHATSSRDGSAGDQGDEE